MTDHDLEGQLITPRRALNELNRIHVRHLTAGDRNIRVTTRRSRASLRRVDRIIQILTSSVLRKVVRVRNRASGLAEPSTVGQYERTEVAV